MLSDYDLCYPLLDTPALRFGDRCNIHRKFPEGERDERSQPAVTAALRGTARS